MLVARHIGVNIVIGEWFRSVKLSLTNVYVHKGKWVKRRNRLIVGIASNHSVATSPT